MTKMVIFRLKTVLLWSHNKHKHFWRSLPAADHDSRDSRRRTSCVQCKKENAFSCSEQARNHCYALQHIFLGMLSRADVLSSCSSAARAHGGAASAGVTGVLSTAHQTNKLSLARETSPPKIWPHRICSRGQSFSASRLLIFNFFFLCHVLTPPPLCPYTTLFRSPHAGWETIADSSSAPGVNPVVLWPP